MTIQDQQLELFTRLSLMLCIDRRDAVRVTRDSRGSINIVPSRGNMKHFIGKAGSRVRAIKLLGARMQNPADVNLTRVGDDASHTDSSRYDSLDGLVLLQDILECITGHRPQVSDEPDSKSQRHRVWIPGQYHDPEIAAALDEALYPISYLTGQYLGFEFVSV